MSTSDEQQSASSVPAVTPCVRICRYNKDFYNGEPGLSQVLKKTDFKHFPFLAAWMVVLGKEDTIPAPCGRNMMDFTCNPHIHINALTHTHKANFNLTHTQMQV